eukprot:scaffold131086_cov66-Phaeocystis_antarctica.AAC.1
MPSCSCVRWSAALFLRTCASCTSGGCGGRSEAPPGRRCRPSLPSAAATPSAARTACPRSCSSKWSRPYRHWGWPRERRSAPSRATASTLWSCTAGARWRLRSTAPRTFAVARPPARRRSSGGSCARPGGRCCRCPTGSGWPSTATMRPNKTLAGRSISGPLFSSYCLKRRHMH